MKCRYCGYEIPEDEVCCGHCGKEVRIVPDYNPLDDVLAAQIKGEIDGGGRPLDDYDYIESYTSDMGRSRKREMQDRRTAVRRRQETAPGRTAARAQGRNTGRTSGRTGAVPPAGDKRRRQAERRREKKKRLRRRLLIFMALFVVVLGVLIFVLYRNSYAGQVSQGNKALAEGAYTEADQFFDKAIKKAPERAEAYEGLAKSLIKQDKEAEAEKRFLEALEDYPEAVDVYRACIAFYVDVEEPQKVSVILEDAKDKVRSALAEYVSEGPSFSLDDTKVYDDVQQLTLESDGEAIYYTVDGSDPDLTSQKYSEPIQIEEGTVTITAISVNKKGIPSLPVSREYTVEFPIEDAPFVSPSTGQYEEPTKIEITVPDGYTAYYTMDESDPTEESLEYTGPIDMPEGNCIFKAVLVNGKGRKSGVTMRNYTLELSGQ